MEVLDRAPKRAPAKRDEAWLAGLWERQAFDRRELRSISGTAFQVVYPGRRTGEAGPDFHDAILALPDGSLLRGDVEIHLDSRGWEQHGHGRDPAYDRVLLHVVLVASGPTHTSRGDSVLTLELANRLPHRSGEPVPTPQPANPLAHPSGEAALAPEPAAASCSAQLSYVVAPCRRQLPRLDVGELQRLLRGLALERFEAKQATFEGELAVYEPDQVLYAGLLEALGYSRNRAPFRQLAALVPLLALPVAAADIEALLLEAANLPPTAPALTRMAQAGLPQQRLNASAAHAPRTGPANLPTAAPPASRMAQAGLPQQRLNSSAAHTPRTGPDNLPAAPPPASRMAQAGLPQQRLNASAWQSLGVRPANWPARRIAQAAQILARLSPDQLLSELLQPLTDRRETSFEPSTASHHTAPPLPAHRSGNNVTGRQQPSLPREQAQHHEGVEGQHRPPASSSSGGKALRREWQALLPEVGPQRADAIAINVLLPFAAAYGQATCQFWLSEMAVESFLSYPPCGANQVTSYMRREVLGPLASAPAGAAGEQALLHVWQRWCHEKVCALCPLGAKIRR